ncbi:hypothetical protein EJB05_10804 [Eragrostis curvula]|uniref:Uncharacterized protein n=1 Tax=Eragrostis curvula TaxID=38414 RepID=A0A5J9VNZ1_9POAL|nr:hypothetical protein EJB05_10804 [Eragrostis curvula]
MRCTMTCSWISRRASFDRGVWELRDSFQMAQRNSLVRLEARNEVVGAVKRLARVVQCGEKH